jgi:hypothetical protein
MKKLIILIFICVACAGSISAQTDWHLDNLMTINWQIATPLSTNYLKETSLAGGNFEYRRLIKPK